MKYDIVIVGGGASGLAAAISASSKPDLAIAIAEKQPRVGKKLLATGNGRCNIFNTQACPEAFYGDRAFTRPALAAFPFAEATRFFAALGLSLRAEGSGCVYPLSNQAAAVLDCLRFSAAEAGVEEICDCAIASIRPQANAFRLCAEDGRALEARRVIVATGGMAAPKLGGGNGFKALLTPLKHRVTPCLPALTPLKTRSQDVAGLKGIKYAGEIALLVDGAIVKRERGEILFTETGVSGIAAMQLSLPAAEALARARRVEARLSPLDMPPDQARAFLQARARALARRPLEEFLTGVVAKRIGQAALKRAGAVPLSRAAGSLSEGEIARLAQELTAWRLPVSATGGFDAAQVMLGGAVTADFHPETMESRLVRGLYACGELLDVTGPCGGYNLTWAWASGALAGRSAAESL